MLGTLLEVNDVHIDFNTDYGVIQAVRGVSFKLNAGETLAVVGESGCGKSVLCKSIARILPHSGLIREGNIYFNGIDLTLLSPKEMNRIRGKEIAMVFQDAFSALDPTCTIGSQIIEAIRIHEKINRNKAKRRAIQLLEQVEIDSPQQRLTQYPHQFSGGMCQRVVLAIALACDPKLLIADEPTTALDGTIQAQILKLIKNLQKTTEAATLFITHDLSVAAQIAQRIAVMYAGKIVEIGTTQEIFGNPRHPYTWALMSSLPANSPNKQPLRSIPGLPPNLLHPPCGDAFAARNAYALAIDYKQEPPLFQVSNTHFAATWLLDPRAPEITPPISIGQNNNRRGEPNE